MKRYICLLAAAALFTACQEKTTVTPAGEKKEGDTTIVNPPSGGTESKTESKTDINVGSSPSSGSETETTTTTTSSPHP